MSGALDRPQGLYALAPAAQPMSRQDMLARLLRGNPDPGLPGYPVMQSSEDRGFAPMPRSFADAGARMAAVLRGDVEPTPEEGRQIATVRGFTEGPASIRNVGIKAFTNQGFEDVPQMIGRDGGVTTETVKRFFEDRNIPYKLEHSRSMSSSFGPSSSQYFKIATPDEIQTVRLSDHFYPSSASVDLRYGQPLSQAENQLAELLKLKVSPEAEIFEATQAKRAAADLAERQRLEEMRTRLEQEGNARERRRKRREALRGSE
jgi:hypothetical protein